MSFFSKIGARMVDYTMSLFCVLAALLLLGTIVVTVIEESPSPPHHALSRQIADFVQLSYRPGECLTPKLPGNQQSTIVLEVMTARDYDYVVRRIDVIEPVIVLHKDSQEGWERTLCLNHLMRRAS